jgi:hypothetical protein
MLPILEQDNLDTRVANTDRSPRNLKSYFTKKDKFYTIKKFIRLRILYD